MDYIKFYSNWAIKAARRTGVSARWWAEHHGWKAVCWFIDNGGESALDRSFSRWCQPDLPFLKK
tara:strand:- start:1169 stop:1360 length:192 start_codon:yes stop_codon:yes gene_type:complete